VPVTVECRIDAEAGIVHTTVSGEIGASDIIAALEELFRHPDYRPGLIGLADLRSYTWRSEMSDIRRVAQFMIANGKKIGRSRTAIVVSSDYSYGMSRMYEAFAAASPIEVKIFRDMDEAVAWLRDDRSGRPDSGDERHE
jgi:hypothetical protein